MESMILKKLLINEKKGRNMNITGAITALITPMKETGQIDYDSLEKLIEMQIEQGISALVAVGTTGESSTLDVQDHLEVIGFFIDKVKGRIPIIAGTGANSTDEACHLTKEVYGLGADAVLLVTPYYNKPTQEGLYRHYMKIADSIDIPQILYNVPSRTAVHMESSTVSRLASHENIIGLKDATGDMAILKELQKSCSEELLNGDFFLYTGDDATSYEFLNRGGHGTISVTSNVFPDLVSLMCAMIKDNNPEAINIHNKLIKINELLFIESNPIPVKYSLNKMGLIEKGIRLPLTHLQEKYQQVIDDELQNLNAI
jgi:4-hydroxy-tetrahydrodipicolinate synthase